MSDRLLAVILLAVAAVGALLVPPPKWLVLLLAAAPRMGWLWLCRRYPLVAIAIFGFLRGLLGGRR